MQRSALIPPTHRPNCYLVLGQSALTWRGAVYCISHNATRNQGGPRGHPRIQHRPRSDRPSRVRRASNATANARPSPSHFDTAAAAPARRAVFAKQPHLSPHQSSNALPSSSATYRDRRRARPPAFATTSPDRPQMHTLHTRFRVRAASSPACVRGVSADACVRRGSDCGADNDRHGGCVSQRGCGRGAEVRILRHGGATWLGCRWERSPCKNAIH